MDLSDLMVHKGFPHFLSVDMRCVLKEVLGVFKTAIGT